MRLVGIMLACGLLMAQERDFLNSQEVEQLRLIQEPNARLQLYAGYAKARLDMVDSLLAQKRDGRSRLIHQTLEDFTRILDAMDMVTDDALKRKVDVTEGIQLLLPLQKGWIERLKKVESSEPEDLARYEFQLRQAIASAEDSLELNSEDLAARGREVVEKVAEEKKAREAAMRPEELAERKEQEKKEEEKKRKAPTLLRKGEAVKPK